MNRKYELVVILDTKSEEQEKLTSKIKKFIADIDGKIESFKELGKKELTYPIKKSTSGFFAVYNFSAEADKTASLKQKLQNEESLLRFLLVVIDKGGK